MPWPQTKAIENNFHLHLALPISSRSNFLRLETTSFPRQDDHP